MSSTGDFGWVMEAVELYELPLLRYARRLLGDVDLAADAVQHAFVKLCEESASQLEGRVAPWLFRVCRNRAVDHLRRSGREQTLVELTPDGEARTGSPLEDPSVGPATAVEQRELTARLRELMHALPAAQREAIDLWCEGFTYRQIAEITARQEGHIRVLAHRGLSALRRHPLVRQHLAEARPAHS